MPDFNPVLVSKLLDRAGHPTTYDAEALVAVRKAYSHCSAAGLSLSDTLVVDSEIFFKVNTLPVKTYLAKIADLTVDLDASNTALSKSLAQIAELVTALAEARTVSPVEMETARVRIGTLEDHNQALIAEIEVLRASNSEAMELAARIEVLESDKLSLSTRVDELLTIADDEFAAMSAKMEDIVADLDEAELSRADAEERLSKTQVELAEALTELEKVTQKARVATMTRYDKLREAVLSQNGSVNIQHWRHHYQKQAGATDAEMVFWKKTDQIPDEAFEIIALFSTEPFVAPPKNKRLSAPETKRVDELVRKTPNVVAIAEQVTREFGRTISEDCVFARRRALLAA